MLFVCAMIFLTFILGLYLYFKRSFTYWEKRNLPTSQPRFPFGNFQNPLCPKYSLGFVLKNYYEEFKSKGLKHAGLYNLSSPSYFPVDPVYIKNILQKDFDHFIDRGRYYNEKDDPLSAHLFNIGGQKWRDLRRKLTPTFTSGKMKMMFDTLLQCSHKLRDAVGELCEKNQTVDIREAFARYATDIIGNCAFGLEFNSFNDPKSEFRYHGSHILTPPGKIQALAHFLGTAKPELANSLGIKLMPEISTNFFFNIIDKTVKFREENNVVRNDMLQLMIALKDNQDQMCNDGKNLTIEEIAAQAMIFFLAGFDTSSTTVTYCFFELVQHPDIQDKVREEINAVLERRQGKISYEALAEMKYLEQVIEETLRKHPVLPFITRKCVKNYKVPNTEVVIEKGTVCFVSILGLHHDEEYFPEPRKFDPERFSVENKQKIGHFSYFPFGEGPRICLGLRFGMMQVKLGLVALLRDFKFTLSEKTEVPLKLKRDTVMLINETVVYLDAKKIH